MDVSFYIGELLQLKGKVSVPGLGYFFYQQKNAYYNEREGKFYPPHNQIKFEPQLIDDDLALTQYIADKNDITLSSSQYFTEKYITTAKQQALAKEVPIAHLGWLFTAHGQINFKEGGHFNTDPMFFGFKPVEVNRVGHTTFTEDYNNLVAEPVAVVAEEPETQAVGPIVAESDGPPMLWFIVLGAFLALAISAIVIFEFFPSVFSKITGKAPVEKTVLPKAIAPIIPKLDTNAGKSDTTALKQDSAKNALAVPAADTSKGNYLIIEQWPSKATINAEIKRLKSLDVNASLATIPGPRSKIAIGPYNTEASAEKEMADFLAAKKIIKKSYIYKIKP